MMLLLVFLLALAHSGCGALNVLVLHPLHGASHEAQLRTLAAELLRRGHHVTTVRFEPARRPGSKAPVHPEQGAGWSNLTLISLTVPNEDGSVPFVTHGRRGKFQLPLERLWRSGLCPFQVPLSAFRTNDALCSVLLPERGRLRRRLHPRRFDVAVVDAMANECGFALAHALGAPAVAYWALPMSGGEADYLAGLWRPPPLAHTPSILTGLTDHMGYLQRIQNAFFRTLAHVVMLVQFWSTHAAIQRHLPGSPHPRALLADVAGVLENSDVALDYPRALPPNVINVGCMQCRAPKPLPPDLEDFVEGSGSAGVVVFSMGATIDAAVAPRVFLRRLLGAFGRLPQRVLVKFDGPLGDGVEVPPNVKIMAWMPQQDLIGHRRTRAFFSHCGLHGALEAVYHGVPVVAMPVYGDQGDVAAMLQHRGMAVTLAKAASEQDIYSALAEVIGDPRYKRSAQRQQAILRDAAQTPMERAVWLVEYVARHEGASHLRLANRHFSALQLLGLDIALPPLLLFIVLIVIKRRRGMQVSRAAAPPSAAGPAIPLVSTALAHARKAIKGAILAATCPYSAPKREQEANGRAGETSDGAEEERLPDENRTEIPICRRRDAVKQRASS